MSRYPAIDDLLATRPPLPAPAERSRLRTSLALTADAVAHAIGISPATLHAWEEGYAEPQGPVRAAYAYFLTHACTCAAEDPNLALNQPAPDTSTELLPQHTFCVLCGNPASQQVDGYPQRLTAAECAEAATPLPALSLPKPDETPQPRIPHPRSGASHRSNTTQDLIGETVAAALAAHDGDQRQAIAALTARTIPDALRLLDACRIGARYDIVRHPALPETLRKPSPHAPDRVWEARPDWQRPQAPDQTDPVAALNINGAYLAALKTHLPLGQLQPTAPHLHDRVALASISSPPQPGNTAPTCPTLSGRALNLDLSGLPSPLCGSCCGYRAPSTHCVTHRSSTSPTRPDPPRTCLRSSVPLCVTHGPAPSTRTTRSRWST
ncbi:DNA-binding XRE family transcriptional regulator [Streptomyces zagrosensis]|uniref:DNA-binding XRE family transcriptional regulator n=1 Tax=Streptomyces zagrosensis TaxID=1042984 RepID=A0A7W9V2T9_9ACTN|nr:DNA-binding XRE family transcriptional regulator [Streptomyces zagrosensis]